MPKTKTKTHKGIAKRSKLTSTGKIKRSQAFHRHKMTSKTGKRRRNLRQSVLINQSFAKKYRKLLA